MNLSQLIIDTKDAWVEYPGLDGFEVKIATFSRPEMKALYKRCTNTVIDKKTRLPTEVLDEAKFGREFAKASIKDWRGLKLSYLQELLLVDLGDKDPNSELKYSEDDAQILVSNSTTFDQWVTEVVQDLDNFRSGTKSGSTETSGKVA